MGIRENWQTVRENISRAALRSGRRSEDVEIVCVTKTVGPDEIRKAFEAGARIFGENRVQDAASKRATLADLPVRWDLIGHLQTNKVKPALDTFDFIHSVDSVRLAREIAKRAEMEQRVMPILLEVNVFGEESKFGLAPEELPQTLESLSEEGHLRIEGLMTMAPFVDDPEETRGGFARIRELAGELRERKFHNAPLHRLSMGMTNDYRVAVEEGATLVRIGSAIFAGE